MNFRNLTNLRKDSTFSNILHSASNLIFLMPTDHKTKFGAALRSLLEQNSTCIQLMFNARNLAVGPELSITRLEIIL